MKPTEITVGIGDKTRTAKLYYGQDVRTTLKSLPEASVHTVCTSPPYWGLRSYDENAVKIDPNLDPEKLEWLIAELQRRGIQPE